MSIHFCNNPGMPYFVRFFDEVEFVDFTPTAITLNVGLVELEHEPISQAVNLARKHRDFTPNHRKNRRGKFKPSGGK